MSTESTSPLIELHGVAKTFAPPVAGATACAALRGVSLRVQAGEFVAVTGASGSGKTTLLHVLAGIERAEQGTLRVAGQRLDTLDEAALTAWRGRRVGVVFQFFQLLPTLTVLENVMLPLDLAGVGSRVERRDHAFALIDRLGITEQAMKFPLTLSGGQQQRVAVARALVRSPALLLADEPTGNLDSHNGAALLDLLAGLVAERGLTLVMVTHDAAAVQRAPRRVRLVDGAIVADESPQASA